MDPFLISIGIRLVHTHRGSQQLGLQEVALRTTSLSFATISRREVLLYGKAAPPIHRKILISR